MELNERLAVWAGFSTSFYSHGRAWFIDNKTLYRVIKEDENDADCLPDFTHDLNACFRWIVPLVQQKGYVVSLIAYEQTGFGCLITPFLSQEPFIEIQNNIASEALCFAVDRLIKWTN